MSVVFIRLKFCHFNDCQYNKYAYLKNIICQFHDNSKPKEKRMHNIDIIGLIEKKTFLVQVQDGPKDVTRCCLALICFLNKKLRL